MFRKTKTKNTAAVQPKPSRKPSEERDVLRARDAKVRKARAGYFRKSRISSRASGVDHH